MDNHPIPQDVTHFQFKLIGELTIKQFAYVAVGGIIAWIAISLPINFLIKFLIALIFGGTGAFFAFIPIEGRAADLMLSYFFKALFKPNQYIFHKQNGLFSFTDLPHAMMPLPAQQAPNVTPPIAHSAALPIQQAQRQFLQPSPIPSTVIPVTPPVMKPEQAPLPQPIDTLRNTQTVLPPAPIPQQKEHDVIKQVNTMGDQLQDILLQKQQLEQQLARLQQQIAQKEPQQQIQSSPSPQQTPALVAARNVSPPPSTGKAPMVSDFPNVIIGVVKDARENVLPNILIEVKDNDDNPVRAFKTNALGQFASATPLLNGAYTILFEDPAKKHMFQPINITVTGEVMQPIIVTSVDEREELRKELFG